MMQAEPIRVNPETITQIPYGAIDGKTHPSCWGHLCCHKGLSLSERILQPLGPKGENMRTARPEACHPLIAVLGSHSFQVLLKPFELGLSLIGCPDWDVPSESHTSPPTSVTPLQPEAHP